jgi:hypothetical protein
MISLNQGGIMKAIIILGALALTVPAIAAKNYQYKDISRESAIPIPHTEKEEIEAQLEVAKRNLQSDQQEMQKQEARIEEDEALVRDLEGRLIDAKSEK